MDRLLVSPVAHPPRSQTSTAQEKEREDALVASAPGFASLGIQFILGIPMTGQRVTTIAVGGS